MKIIHAVIAAIIASPAPQRKLTGAEVAQLAQRIGVANTVAFLNAARRTR